jgi:hypothetical protein
VGRFREAACALPSQEHLFRLARGHGVTRFITALRAGLSAAALLCSAPAWAVQSPNPVDIAGLSDAFATYHRPDIADQAVEQAIPSGTRLSVAEATVKGLGGYCRTSPRTGVTRCGAVVSVIMGDGAIVPVRWDIDLTTVSDRVSSVRVRLS